MVRLCNDIDILKYEPALFGELHPSNQVLTAGDGGEMSGTTFTASGADFESAAVEPGGVIYLRSGDGAIDGAYEIAAVDSATQLCVSVLRADLEADPIAPPESSDISYRISTFRPQAAEVSLRLAQYLGIQPGRADSEVSADNIIESDILKQVCAFGVISAAYAMLADSEGGERFWEKSLRYERLFEKGKERCRAGLDTNGDGFADSVRFGGSGRLVRD